MPLFLDKNLKNIHEKIRNNLRLSFEDGLNLLKTQDLLGLGYLASLVKENLHSKKVYYVFNQHVNYSNICLNLCKFCAFGKPPEHPDAYELDIEEIIKKLKKNPSPVREIHIVGGLNPRLPYEYYLDLLKTIKKEFPLAQIKAFTCVEIEHLARLAQKSIEEVLKDLKSAGLSCLPGGGAEVFSERIRKKLCPEKISGKRWLEIARTAHKLGIPTNATMLYGHLETYEERIEHLIALRQLQDETKGFLCFIPLPFLPQKSYLKREVAPTTGFEDLKMMAVARLMLDNIPHIKAYWVFLGLKLAQVALHFGADDLHGTVYEEKISDFSGAEGDKALSRKEIERLIREAGFEPVERDALYRPV
ncbi:Radical SAM domain protein [Thermodesulfatator indicus DSM 15286]|uniref:Aminodeoxyfutalosine synthase n=1 Tax=Thermodesulfatator indicus (strain DSM 15286 / JCM 11887 / CIR29812) TaxID=667014 RepID=F8A8K8_THEID|nr:aminofutalosine synthase MqnE [Thermodesulfatator indicus]AEH45094.1 Radical SAM domain protein [Thermodesulfatator indicus DSM 15286]